MVTHGSHLVQDKFGWTIKRAPEMNKALKSVNMEGGDHITADIAKTLV